MTRRVRREPGKVTMGMGSKWKPRENLEQIMLRIILWTCDQIIIFPSSPRVQVNECYRALQ
jgi:hypothetical protein